MLIQINLHHNRSTLQRPMYMDYIRYAHKNNYWNLKVREPGSKFWHCVQLYQFPSHLLLGLTIKAFELCAVHVTLCVQHQHHWFSKYPIFINISIRMNLHAGQREIRLIQHSMKYRYVFLPFIMCIENFIAYRHYDNNDIFLAIWLQLWLEIVL